MFILFSPSAITGGVGEAKGIWNSVTGFAKMMGLDEAIPNAVGAVAKPLVKSKKDESTIHWLMSKLTTLDIFAALAVVGNLLVNFTGLFQTPEGEEGKKESWTAWGLKKLCSPIVIGLSFILSRMSLSNLWHLPETDRLLHQGILKPFTKKDVKDASEMSLDPEYEYLYWIFGSAKNEVPFALYGNQGNGKTEGAKQVILERVLADRKLFPEAQAYILDPVQLIRTLEQRGKLSQELGADIMGGQDVLKSLIDVSEKVTTEQGCGVVLDDLTPVFYGLKTSGEVELLKATFRLKSSGRVGVTTPAPLKWLLYKNPHLRNIETSSKVDIPNLLQSIYFISLPMPKRIQSCTDKMKRYIYKEGDAYAHSPKAQINIWEKAIRERLLNKSKNKFELDAADRAEIAKYLGFDLSTNTLKQNSKVHEFVDKYPMNPRYIEHSVDNLGILFYEAKKRGKRANLVADIGRAFEGTVIQCLTFQNFVESVTPFEEAAADKREGPYDIEQLFKVYCGALRAQKQKNSKFKIDIDNGIEDVEGKLKSKSLTPGTAIEEFLKGAGFVQSDGHNLNKVKFSPSSSSESAPLRLVKAAFDDEVTKVECYDRHEIDVDFDNLVLYKLERFDGENDQFCPILAYDKKKSLIYRGYAMQDGDRGVIRIRSVCNNLEKFLHWFA